MFKPASSATAKGLSMSHLVKLGASFGAALGISSLGIVALPVAAHAEIRGGPSGTVFCPPHHNIIYGGKSGRSLESAKAECAELGLSATVQANAPATSATLAPVRPRNVFVPQAEAATIVPVRGPGVKKPNKQ